MNTDLTKESPTSLIPNCQIGLRLATGVRTFETHVTLGENTGSLKFIGIIKGPF